MYIVVTKDDEYGLTATRVLISVEVHTCLVHIVTLSQNKLATEFVNSVYYNEYFIHFTIMNTRLLYTTIVDMSYSFKTSGFMHSKS